MASHCPVYLVGLRAACGKPRTYTSLTIFHHLTRSLRQVAWPFIANFSCASPSDCPRASNQGWRYFMYTMGGIMLVLSLLRVFVFDTYESPKYLMGRGRDAEAVEIVHKVARYNGRVSSLTLEMLQDAERTERGANTKEELGDEAGKPKTDTSMRAAVLRNLKTYSGGHIKLLFATRKLAYSTTLQIILWGVSST